MTDKEFNALLMEKLEELPYTKHLDDGQFNDGQLYGFECGANWAYEKILKSGNLTEKQLSLSEKVHEGQLASLEIEDIIFQAFSKYETEIYKTLDFSITTDYYDNSIVIKFAPTVSYPYALHEEIRNIILNIGFTSIFLSFENDTKGLYYGIHAGPDWNKLLHKQGVLPH